MLKFFKRNEWNKVSLENDGKLVIFLKEKINSIC